VDSAAGLRIVSELECERLDESGVAVLDCRQRIPVVGIDPLLYENLEPARVDLVIVARRRWVAHCRGLNVLLKEELPLDNACLLRRYVLVDFRFVIVCRIGIRSSKVGERDVV